VSGRLAGEKGSARGRWPDAPLDVVRPVGDRAAPSGSKEFRRLMVRAALVVENIRVVRFLIGGKPLLEVLKEFEEELKDLKDDD
jgi:hypothetical protein